MKRVFALFAIPLCAVALYGAEISADSTRGAQVFEIQGCGDCHSLNGVGPSVGPDLSRLVDRGFTPASLAATMWNHAPAMWTETRLRGNARPALDEQQAADLFAFFYSLRFFEEPGDAGRGKALFSDRKCAECHGIASAKLPDAKPVMQWTAPADPLALVETMWNAERSNCRGFRDRNWLTCWSMSGRCKSFLCVPAFCKLLRLSRAKHCSYRRPARVATIPQPDSSRFICGRRPLPISPPICGITGSI